MKPAKFFPEAICNLPGCRHGLQLAIYFLLFTFYLLPLQRGASQDIHFSQFYVAPHLLNPAFPGANGYMEGVINYKNQWRSIEDALPYKTVAASYAMRYKKKQWDERDPKNNPFLFKKAPGQGLAWGINLYNDNSGSATMKTLQANLNLAYHVLITKKMAIAAGLQGGVMNRSIDASKLQWGSLYNGKYYDPSYINPNGPPPVPGNDNFMTSDFGAGLLWYFDKEERAVGSNDHLNFMAGGSYLHVNEPAYSFYDNAAEKLYRKAVLHATGNIGIKGTPLSILPSFAWFKQGPATELLLGGHINYQMQEASKYTGRLKGASFSVGGHYRNKDAVILSVQLQMAYYAVGFSYDINTSSLTTATNGRGGIEISIRFLNSLQYLYQVKSKPQT